MKKNRTQLTNIHDFFYLTDTNDDANAISEGAHWLTTVKLKMLICKNQHENVHLQGILGCNLLEQAMLLTFFFFTETVYNQTQ